jgi:hypothetical protein
MSAASSLARFRLDARACAVVGANLEIARAVPRQPCRPALSSADLVDFGAGRGFTGFSGTRRCSAKAPAFP